MSAITTHVLDLTSGRPARGVAVSLAARGEDGRWAEIARGVTDGDGRLRDLLPDGRDLDVGVYALRFETAAYFHSLGAASFYPEVVVVFHVDDPAGHYHVPLLLGPFGYTTYRGS